MSTNVYYGVGGYGQTGYGNQPFENLPIGYYTNLLTHQYALPNSPKLNALLYLLLKKFDDVSQCLVRLDTALDLDIAVGAQLNRLAATAGATFGAVGDLSDAARTVPFQPSNGVSPVLDDTTFRTFIKAKIAQNQWDGGRPLIYALWKLLFPQGQIIIADNQNMTATIFLSGTFTSIVQDLIVNGLIVPRPEGVLYTYTFAELPAFGWDLDNAFVAGFDVGKFS
jgi:Protein of unknown function (DUF2612)